MTQAQTTRANRRASRRQPPKTSTKVRCFKGALGLGANLAVRLLDLSECGVRLTLKVDLAPEQEVEVHLENAASRPVKALAQVVWSVPTADGTFAVGAHFVKPLNYGDLLALTRS